MRLSAKTVLASIAAIVALWAPAYLALLDHAGLDSAAESEALQWALFAVGAAGLGTILYTAWRDTRDPAWRAAHPQLRHAPPAAR
jgi:hypothetical protein